MSRRVLSIGLISSLAASVALVACGQRNDEVAPENTTPIVGALEVAISRNHSASNPSGAARIEISPDELRLDGHSIVALERGRVAAAELADHVVTKLRTQLSSGSGRRSAALWVNANVPYLTLAQVMKTLEASGVREASFAVRSGTTGPATGWMRLARWHVVPAGDAPVEFQSPSRPWSAFADHWDDVYEACRAGQYIDCDGRALNIAQGGNLQVLMWARGQGMKVTFMQVVPPGTEAPAAPAANRGPALIEGVRAPPPVAEEDHGPPTTEAAFNFRHQESVADDSAISNTVRPVCANEACQAVLDADATTPSMRVLSMIGAVFPDGFAEPDIAFRLPEEH